MKRILSAALLLGSFAAVPLAPSPASAEPPTCRGLEATHVGTPGEALTTTPGRDIVVTNGADIVRTLNGNDVICATRTRFVYIVPGGGNDVVDATKYDGDSLETSLGQYAVDGSSGDDTYLGGDQADQVFVSSGVAGDHKKIHLDGGQDYLNVDRDYTGRIAAEMGKDNDVYKNDHPRPGVVVDGEEGRDGIVTQCLGCGAFEAYLPTGRLVVNGDPGGRALLFEDVTVIKFGNPAVDFVLVWGTDGPNDVEVNACTAGLRGRAGADTMSVQREGCGSSDDGAIIGGAGDDVLVGSNGPDVLRGGDGHDEAHGGGGNDLCRAEVTTECES